MTPNDVEILLHFHCSGIPHPRASAPAVRESIARFIDTEALTHGGPAGYRTTAKGDAWVRMICDTPEPEGTFFDPRSRRTFTSRVTGDTFTMELESPKMECGTRPDTPWRPWMERRAK